MKNGYKIHWTPNALDELAQTIEYLRNNFTEKESIRPTNRILIRYKPLLNFV